MAVDSGAHFAQGPTLRVDLRGRALGGLGVLAVRRFSRYAAFPVLEMARFFARDEHV